MAIVSRGYWAGAGDEPPERKRPRLEQCQPYTLPRDGQRPIRFSGLLLAEHFGKPDPWSYREAWGGMRVTGYYELAVYHVAEGGYIVHWVYLGQQESDIPHHAVQKCGDVEEAIGALEMFDPVQWVAALSTPDDQARVRERYHAQVAALCDALDVVEEW